MGVVHVFVVLVRTAVLYLLIIAGLRLLGKRQLGELEPAELTLALIIADLASVPMQDNGIPLLTGLIPIAVLLCLATILSVLAYVLWVNVKVTIRDAIKGKFVYKAKIKEA